MNITILCVGKIKEACFRDAVGEYAKRMRRYARLSIVEVADEKTPDNASEADNARILRIEGERLLARIRPGDYVCALAIQGQTRSSEAFADYIEKMRVLSKGNLVFVIGGSLGLAPEVMARANDSISFSPMTFPHQLMRVILLEQIYRAHKIIHKEPYHK